MISAAFRLSKNWKVVFVSARNMALKRKCFVKKWYLDCLSSVHIGNESLWVMEEKLQEWRRGSYIVQPAGGVMYPLKYKHTHFHTDNCFSISYTLLYTQEQSLSTIILCCSAILPKQLQGDNVYKSNANNATNNNKACITRILPISLPLHSQCFILALHYHTVWSQGFDISQVQEVIPENDSMSGRVLYSCGSKASVL